MAEALQQRLDVYKQQQQAAQDQGNSSKARRMGRIVKQYEDAIRQDKAGKAIAADELPTPPGFAPIPVEGAVPIPPQPTREAPALPPKGEKPGPAKPSPTRTASRSGRPICYFFIAI